MCGPVLRLVGLFHEMCGRLHSKKRNPEAQSEASDSASRRQFPFSLPAQTGVVEATVSA